MYDDSDHWILEASSQNPVTVVVTNFVSPIGSGGAEPVIYFSCSLCYCKIMGVWDCLF